VADTPSRAEILIVGAGPTGLVLAIWLTQLGVRVRIIDKVAEPGTTSRALAVQARTLEFYQQVGLAEAIVEREFAFRTVSQIAVNQPHALANAQADAATIKAYLSEHKFGATAPP
jgi:2-polyprenyl-6-methoxyphenol hydroxylase-like FAD-dependent oxidoreductase